MTIYDVEAKSVLTRVTGYLRTVSSHSLQPYQGCTFGRAACGEGCYVRHNPWMTRGRPWGTFLGIKRNAAQCYRAEVNRERKWAHRALGEFSIFMSSSTDPFLPQEFVHRITKSILDAMIESPPDRLILQTHSHRVIEYQDAYAKLSHRCRLRFHLTIESDLETLPGLPPPASSVSDRLEAAARLKQDGHRVLITVSPLWPIQDPPRFFRRLGDVSDGVVLDHFMGGDGSPDGRRTRKTKLPEAMRSIEARTTDVDYLHAMVSLAQEILPGRIGVHRDGFAGRFLPRASSCDQGER